MRYRQMQQMFGAAQFARNGLGAFGRTEERDPEPSTAAPYSAKIKPGALVDSNSGVTVCAAGDWMCQVQKALGIGSGGAPVEQQESSSGFWAALKSLVPAQAPSQGITPLSLNEGPGIGTFVLIGFGVLVTGAILFKVFK